MMSSKHDYANYDQFAPNSDITYKTTQHVSVPNLNYENKVTSQRSQIIFMGKWAGGLLLLTNMDATI